jgi:hypothetical protein
MTYLELVNAVLKRLREDEVTTVTASNYSKLIGSYVNDAKMDVENSYSWNSLSDTLTVNTGTGIFNYTLVGSGQRFEVIDVWNNSANQKFFLENRPVSWMTQALLTENPQQNAPMYYAFNGEDANGDTQVDIYPIPNGVYQIFFNITKPQPDLVNNTDRLLVPSLPVIMGAYARALAERGEDGGIGSGDAFMFYQKALGDAIAIESNRYVEESNWGAV